MSEQVRKVASKLMYAIPVAIFLGFVFYITSMTYTGTIQKTVESTKWNFDSFVGLSDQFEKVLQNGIYKKYGFINLNGRIAKYLGFNSLNQVQKLSNGFLAGFSRARDVTWSVKKIIELNEFLAKRGIPFLYVIAPTKNSIYDTKFAPGYGDDSWKNIGNIIGELSMANVNNLDMNFWFKKNGWHMEDVFFKTDFHWKPQAGLETAQLTMTWLQQQGLAKVDVERIQSENYKVKVLKNWFLGSQGKRTGKQFAGVDDITIYYPKFKTNYLYFGLHGHSTNWFYSSSLLDLSYTKRKEYFEQNPYCIYMHKDFAFLSITNTLGLNDKKVLIIGDSYKMVVEYFLAPQFRQIYTVDKRYNTDETIAQYVEEIKPDIVLMYVQSVDNEQLYEFGITEYNKALIGTNSNEPKISLGDFEIRPQNNNNNFVTVGTNLRPGQTYTLTADNTKILEGSTPYIQITLLNQSTNSPVANHYFEPDKTFQQKWIFTVPNKPDNYALCLYAGSKNHTAHNSVRVANILLRKGIHED